MSRILRLLIAQLVAQQRYRAWREARRRTSTYDSTYDSAYESAQAGQDRSATSDGPGVGATRDPDIARCYAALELSYGADLVAVRASYKRLVKLYHPDRFATDPEKMATATQLVRELNDAYECLRRHLGATGR